MLLLPIFSAMCAGHVGPSHALPVADQTVSLAFNGKLHHYILHVPSSLSEATPAPLVLNFHGFTDDAAIQLKWTGFNVAANRNRFVVAYPDGFGNKKSWNGGDCCGDAAAEHLDDIGLARAIVADIMSRVNIDAHRIYVTGFSNGGFLTHRIACEAADLFAAAAAVGGVLGIAPPRCQPARPMPILQIHGTADAYVPYEGGKNRAASGKDFRSVAETIATWVDRDSCTDAPPHLYLRHGTARCERYNHCAGGAMVALCTLKGVGHCWPGNLDCAGFGKSTTDLLANEEIWAFLSTFRLP
jgi:polyhydroxybutyrate depolymerase